MHPDNAHPVRAFAFPAFAEALLQWRAGLIRDDGTNIYCELSTNGADWITFSTVAKSSGFLGSSGYNQAAVILSNSNAGTGNTMQASLSL